MNKILLRSNTTGLAPARLAFPIATVLCFVWIASLQAQTITISNLWSISTAEGRSYVTSGATERGIAYNPATGHVLLVSRAPGLQVAILDSNTGVEVGFLDTTGISGGTFALSLIGVADDGAIYGGNLSGTSTSIPVYRLYRWADETSMPAPVYVGNPGVDLPQRWGDTLNVRGASTNTQVLIASQGLLAAILMPDATAPDPTNTFAVTRLDVSGISSGDLQKGVAFGTNNTFYGKHTASGSVRHLSFDLGTNGIGTATLITNYPIANPVAGVTVDITNNLLAGVQTSQSTTNHQLVVYDISTPGAAALIGSIPFPTPNVATPNAVGGIDIGGGRIFAVDTANGVVAAQIVVSQAAIGPTVVTDPAAQTAVEGGYVNFSVSASGTKPLAYQWYFNATNAIANATSNLFTLTNVQLSDAGGYHVTVTNTAGSTNSATAVLTVNPSIRSVVATQAWRLSPGDRSYLTSDNNQRGLAYNPLTTNLVMVSRSLSNAIYVLDAKTGAHLRALNTDPSIVRDGGTFVLNMIGVADDGAVYACSLSVSENGLTIYRWNDDSTNSAPAIAYGPTDPVAGRWGDTMAVRGSGNNTQILLAARDGGTYAVFTTADNGASFTPAIITVADAVSDTFTLGLSFGETNSFWTKISGGVLRHIEFDLVAGTGTSAQTFTTADLAGNILPIGVDTGQGLLAGISLETPDNVRLYDISTLTNPPVNIDTDFFPTDNVNGNGTGSVAFGNDMLFVLDTNNGLLALDVQRTHGDFFPVRIELRGSDVVLTWIGTWTLQSSTNLVDGFGNVSGATSPYTNSITSAPQMFFRLRN